MGFIRFIVGIIVFVALVFGFMTFFQYGTNDFTANYKAEVERCIALVKGSPDSGETSAGAEKSPADSKAPIDRATQQPQSSE
ncbi:MAG: hypothetical protein ACK5NG_11455 [Chthoniobacterales bacterium]